MGAGGSLIGPGAEISGAELQRRYSRLLRLPTDASDLFAPKNATEEQIWAALRTAQREVLFLKQELFKLQHEQYQQHAQKTSTDSLAGSSSRDSFVAHESLSDVCSGRDNAEDLQSCITFVSHIRRLLQAETAVTQRRRRLSFEGKKLLQEMLTSDSDTDSDDGLED